METGRLGGMETAPRASERDTGFTQLIGLMAESVYGRGIQSIGASHCSPTRQNRRHAITP